MNVRDGLSAFGLFLILRALEFGIATLCLIVLMFWIDDDGVNIVNWVQDNLLFLVGVGIAYYLGFQYLLVVGLVFLIGFSYGFWRRKLEIVNSLPLAFHFGILYFFVLDQYLSVVEMFQDPLFVTYVLVVTFNFLVGRAVRRRVLRIG